MKNISKTLNTLFIATFLTGFIFLAGCSTPAEKVESADTDVVEAKENLEQAEIDYASELESFKNEINGKITENERTIADIRERMKNDKKEAKAEYKMQIEEIEKKNSDMKKRLEDYREDGKEKWQSFKSELNHDMDELGRSLKDFTVNNK